MHRHAEMGGNGMGLVDAACPGAAYVEFLQGDDGRPTIGDHLGDPRRVRFSVRTNAAMDIVGQYPEHIFFLSIALPFGVSLQPEGGTYVRPIPFRTEYPSSSGLRAGCEGQAEGSRCPTGNGSCV